MAKKSKKNKSSGPVKFRSKYQDHSQRFREWVDDLGFEQTFLGRVTLNLEKRFHIRKSGLLFLYCLLLAFFIFADFEFQQTAQVGQIAKTDYKSPITFTMVDEVSTQKKREEAESAVPPIFDYDPDAFRDVTGPVYIAFRELRSEVKKVRWPKNDIQREEQVKDFLTNKPRFEELLERKVTNRLFEWLVERQFSVRIENVVKNALEEWTSYKIIDAPVNVIQDKSRPLLLKVVDNKEEELSTEIQAFYRDMKDIQNADDFSVKDIRGSNRLNSRDRRNTLALTKSLLFANVTYNKSETSVRREKAREEVLPVQISIKKNQSIVTRGSVIQPIHVTIFNEIKKRKSVRRVDFISLVAAMFFACAVLVFFSYTRRFTLNRIRVDERDLTAMGVVVLAMVIINKFFMFVMESAFVSKFGLSPTVFMYAAPVAAAPMIVGMLVVSGELVWLFTVFVSIVFAIMVDMNFSMFIMSCVGGVAAVRGIHNCEKRNDIYWAGLRTGVVNALVVMLLTSLTKVGTAGIYNEIFSNALAGFAGGILSAFIVMIIIPLLESIFNYTTDLKLLELSNLSHPLMQEMVVKAPGTYHHSLVVGSMCEAGAKEIGANALLAKVMAYYHDIGKMDHAQYFIENQRPGQNPHDHISPYMSKTILVAHVKDGAELGIRHKLGRPIIDGILQHHGTTLISYFYNKAMEESDEDHDYVEESDFRYPGPKPQFKEAALVMLADSIEAAARSLEDPTPARLQNIVQSIIQGKFLDGQLSDCDLTLQDLSIIEEAFEHVILAMYHQRVEYPGQNSNSESKLKGVR
ncbi:MAG: HD family phosphohydrolase [Bdellovibrionaceae bacterium]|nr:HD family phosphohydrolase [Pseudobdellovibrionaceae bacterium]|tara:strand:- start:59275 stop:61680 length:2406 start_codon:yes stop_codon:yes gene_type:complete